MFLHNYAEWQRAVGISVPCTGTGTAATNQLTTLKQTSGGVPGYAYLTGLNAPYALFGNTDWNPAANRAWNLLTGLKFVVGSGTTEVTPDDYNLANNKTSSFVSTAFNVNVGVSADGHFVLVATWNGTNNGNADITITEVGLFKNLGMYNSSTIGSSQIGGISYIDFLIARYILEEPVTINAGDSGTITVKIEMF